jgi:molecular chaperone HtpG
MNDAQTQHIHLEVDVNRIIEVLARQIYQTPLALLRENAQNAFDAILLRRHRGGVFDPAIDVTIGDGEIAIADNGIGMTPEDLREHYWHAGSSGKNTPEARAAGVVGTFGIGAMANFGIAEEIELETESAITGERTRSAAQRDTLSATEETIELRSIPAQGEPGTIVSAKMAAESVDVGEATAYIRDFVRLVDIPVRVNGELVSQEGLETLVPPPSGHADLQIGELQGRITGPVRMRVTDAGEAWVQAADLCFEGDAIKGEIVLRQGAGAIHTYRSGFGLAVASATSVFGFGGAANLEILEPTAGREALTTSSMQILQETVTDLDRLAALAIAGLPQADQSTPLMHWALAQNQLELCERLELRREPGGTRVTLAQVRDQHAGESQMAVYYTGSDTAMITAMASDDSPLLIVAANNPRRRVQITFLEQFCNAERLKDDPSVLSEKSRLDWSVAEQGVVFRVTSTLASDYFLPAEVALGDLSHGLPALVDHSAEPPRLYLDPSANTFQVIAALYQDDYELFGSMVKDFVRNVIFPRVSDLVPSSTREGAEAFLKSIKRTRDVFEYELDDLDSLGSIWEEFDEGKITIGEAARRSQALARQSVQVFGPGAAQNASEVVPDLSSAEQIEQHAEPGAAPPILREGAETTAKLLILAPDQPPVQGYRCFVALSDRVRRERGEFFLQPHSTSVVWGGQKVLFVFEHHSGEFGLYYDMQGSEVVAPESGGGPYPTATLVLKESIFLPVPAELAEKFIPQGEERKRFEVRSDLLYTEGRGPEAPPS